MRHYRARVAENFVLRWLGGMTSRALSEFRSGAEREADRFYGESLAALREDLIACWTRRLRTTRPRTTDGYGQRDRANGLVDGLEGLSAPLAPAHYPRR